MKPKSHTLFHFTSSLDNLTKILTSGFWPRYCSEDFRWYNEALGYVAYPMVCFCDIPLTRITDHTMFYGRFGIGMKRDWAIRAGLNPVMYLSYNSPIRTNVLNLARQGQEDPNFFPSDEHRKIQVDAILNLISVIKPIEGVMEVGDPPRLLPKEFYLENEWRFVPQLEQGRICIPIQKFRTSKDEYNEYTFNNCLLKYSLDDIQYLFVEDDSAMRDILGFLNSLLLTGKQTSEGVDLLKTKLITLESIETDF